MGRSKRLTTGRAALRDLAQWLEGSAESGPLPFTAQAAAEMAFWAMDWRKRKRAWRKEGSDGPVFAAWQEGNAGLVRHYPKGLRRNAYEGNSNVQTP